MVRSTEWAHDVDHHHLWYKAHATLRILRTAAANAFDPDNLFSVGVALGFIYSICCLEGRIISNPLHPNRTAFTMLYGAWTLFPSIIRFPNVSAELVSTWFRGHYQAYASVPQLPASIQRTAANVARRMTRRVQVAPPPSLPSAGTVPSPIKPDATQSQSFVSSSSRQLVELPILRPLPPEEQLSYQVMLRAQATFTVRCVLASFFAIGEFIRIVQSVRDAGNVLHRRILSGTEPLYPPPHHFGRVIRLGGMRCDSMDASLRTMHHHLVPIMTKASAAARSSHSARLASPSHPSANGSEHRILSVGDDAARTLAQTHESKTFEWVDRVTGGGRYARYWTIPHNGYGSLEVYAGLGISSDWLLRRKLVASEMSLQGTSASAPATTGHDVGDFAATDMEAENDDDDIVDMLPRRGGYAAEDACAAGAGGASGWAAYVRGGGVLEMLATWRRRRMEEYEVGRGNRAGGIFGGPTPMSRCAYGDGCADSNGGDGVPAAPRAETPSDTVATTDADLSPTAFSFYPFAFPVPTLSGSPTAAAAGAGAAALSAPPVPTSGDAAWNPASLFSYFRRSSYGLLGDGGVGADDAGQCGGMLIIEADCSVSSEPLSLSSDQNDDLTLTQALQGFQAISALALLRGAVDLSHDDKIARVLLADSDAEMHTGGGGRVTLRKEVERLALADIIIDTKSPLVLSIAEWAARVTRESGCPGGTGPGIVAGLYDRYSAGAAAVPCPPLSDDAAHPLGFTSFAAAPGGGGSAAVAAAMGVPTRRPFNGPHLFAERGFTELLPTLAPVGTHVKPRWVVFDTPSQKYFQTIKSLLSSYGWSVVDTKEPMLNAVGGPYSGAVPVLVHLPRTDETVARIQAIVTRYRIPPRMVCGLFEHTDGIAQLRTMEKHLLLQNHHAILDSVTHGDEAAAAAAARANVLNLNCKAANLHSRPPALTVAAAAAARLQAQLRAQFITLFDPSGGAGEAMCADDVDFLGTPTDLLAPHSGDAANGPASGHGPAGEGTGDAEDYGLHLLQSLYPAGGTSPIDAATVAAVVGGLPAAPHALLHAAVGGDPTAAAEAMSAALAAAERGALPATASVLASTNAAAAAASAALGARGSSAGQATSASVGAAAATTSMLTGPLNATTTPGRLAVATAPLPGAPMSASDVELGPQAGDGAHGGGSGVGDDASPFGVHANEPIDAPAVAHAVQVAHAVSAAAAAGLVPPTVPLPAVTVAGGHHAHVEDVAGTPAVGGGAALTTPPAMTAAELAHLQSGHTCTLRTPDQHDSVVGGKGFAAAAASSAGFGGFSTPPPGGVGVNAPSPLPCGDGISYVCSAEVYDDLFRGVRKRLMAGHSFAAVQQWLDQGANKAVPLMQEHRMHWR